MKIMSIMFIAFAIAALLIVVNITVMSGHSYVVIVPFAILAIVEVYLSLEMAWGTNG